MTEKEFLTALLLTDKANEVRRLVEEFVTIHEAVITWKPVGGRTNNSGSIQVAGDPARALIERVTNGIDAVVQRAYNEHNGRPECRTPREAAAAWFNVPIQGLHQLTPSARRQLALQSVTVRLLEGDGKAKRTVQVADKGVGLAPDAIPRTILSLNAENKLDKFYLIGAFGQGGSATFASSDYTLIVSRDTRAPDQVGFTIVKLQPPAGVKLGSYVYLTRSESVLTCEPVDQLGEYATVVRHYGYDLDDYPSPLGPNSLYGRSQSILFDPVLPFYFENDVHKYSRTIKGSRSALNGAREEDDESSKLSYSCPMFFPDLGEFGRIGIEYWVLEPSTKTAPNKAFVNGARPIVLTVNGQTHAEWTSGLLRKEAGLTHLTSRMVVHISCDDLSDDAKRVLFVSNREESRKGLVQNLIRDELLKAFQSDDRLAQLQEEAKRAGTKERDEEAEREVRREVARMLKVFGYSIAEDAGGAKSSTGDQSKRTGSGDRKAARKPDPIPVVEPPSLLEILASEPIELFPGQRRYLRLRTNAHSRYHDARDPRLSRFSFIVNLEGVSVAGSSELRDGHLRVILAAAPDAQVGTSGSFRVELHPMDQPTIAASIAITIVKEPPAKTNTRQINLPKIDCQPVESMDSEEWVSLNWPKEVDAVAADYDYVTAEDTLVIRYSTLFPRYAEMSNVFDRKDIALGASFRKRFEIWLVMNVLIHWQDVQSDVTSITQSDLEQDQIDEYRRDELRRLVKGCIVYTQREVAGGSPPPEMDPE